MRRGRADDDRAGRRPDLSYRSVRACSIGVSPLTATNVLPVDASEPRQAATIAAVSERVIGARATSAPSLARPVGGSSVSGPGRTIVYARPLAASSASAFPFARR